MHRAKSDKLQAVGISTIVVRNMNTPLFATERPTREKISSDTELNNTISQQNLIQQRKLCGNDTFLYLDCSDSHTNYTCDKTA